MRGKEVRYSVLILAHIGLGILLFSLGFLSKIYSLVIPIFGVLFIMRTQNNNNQVLIACSYLIGSEVLMRMTGGNISHELAKYTVIIYCLMGVYSQYLKKNFYLFGFFIVVIARYLYWNNCFKL